MVVEERRCLQRLDGDCMRICVQNFESREREGREMIRRLRT